jgi:2-amino-4-hydroxy-6-hydroxymethyldihydropteridine diphosphokinase
LPGRNKAEGERVFIGLGGNVGEPARMMAAALHELDRVPGIDLIRVSSLYRTPPWGKLDQPDFLNAAAELSTTLAPRELLETCLAIERGFKRERHERWGPRTIDIDILVFGERLIREEGLEIPHPRLASRAFALVPLAEIAPGLSVAGQPVSDLLRAVDTSRIERIAAAEAWARGG